jgi:hypothetical protein
VEIEVLGPGCQKCQALLSNVKETLARSGQEGEVLKVEDVFDICSGGSSTRRPSSSTAS